MLLLMVAVAGTVDAALLLRSVVVLNFALYRESTRSMSVSTYPSHLASRLEQYIQLTKPRVVALIVFTAIIGMLLATTEAVPL